MDANDQKPPEKLDPETLVLRARPKAAVRFKRSAIIGISSAVGISLMAVTFIALKPQSFLAITREDEEVVGLSRTPDLLAAAPASYEAVPKLGPPLPGDLGRPILEHQKSLGVDPSAPQERDRDQAALLAQQRAADEKAAREAGVLIARGSANPPVSTLAPVEAAQAPAVATDGSGLNPDRDPGLQSRKLSFVAARDDAPDVNPHVLALPASPWMLSAGSVISASLITGLNSDLPGLVTAQVTEHIFDSATGRILLIPQGTRLVGSYDSVVAFGQKRALVVWQRIILPDGSSLRIDNVPATDASGYAGLSDKVDFHAWSLLKGIAVSTLLGVGSELALGSSESDLVKAVRESTQANADRAGQQIVAKNLDIQPTIKVRPGFPVRIVVHKDLVLRPWKG